MNGFNVHQKDVSLMSFENKAGLFRLLVEDTDLEVFESHINVGKSILCQPYESKDSVNIIFVISGRLFHTNDRSYIHPGERIVFKNLDVTHHLSVIEETKLLRIRKGNHFVKQASDVNDIYQLIHKIQEKDMYTEDHCNNSGNLAVQIATMLHLSETQIQNLLYAGKIHDVGKLQIPESILNKPSQLTPAEYEIIKKHSEFGYDIVMRETQNADIAKIVLDHHERLDGSGYPKGLKGDEISIEARIMAVADSFDAMTSNRPYKASISIEAAFEDLQKYTGILYDPVVIDVLGEILFTFHQNKKIAG